ncbi:MAG TPA: hypothetical protein VK932_05655, partial [Kofleriaceae bacterium]|nr:hypothetical protein [Kofleriaceae bacterium]
MARDQRRIEDVAADQRAPRGRDNEAFDRGRGVVAAGDPASVRDALAVEDPAGPPDPGGLELDPD